MHHFLVSNHRLHNIVYKLTVTNLVCQQATSNCKTLFSSQKLYGQRNPNYWSKVNIILQFTNHIKGLRISTPNFLGIQMSCVVRKPFFCICENKDADQLRGMISAFVFATWIAQSLYLLNPKFQVSSHLLWLYSLVCVGPGQNPRKPVFSQQGSNHLDCYSQGVQRRMVLVVNFFIFLKSLFFALLLKYVT